MSNSEMRRMRTCNSFSTSASASSRTSCLRERLEAVVNRGDDGLVRLALLDRLVDALLDEDALQRAVMQFVLSSCFSRNSSSRLRMATSWSVFSRSTSRHGQLHRAVVLDDHDAAGDGRLRNR